MQSEVSVFVSNHILSGNLTIGLSGILVFISQTVSIVADNLMGVQSIGRGGLFLILCCYYFKLFGLEEPKDIVVDLAVNFHLDFLLFGHLFFLPLHLKIQDL